MLEMALDAARITVSTASPSYVCPGWWNLDHSRLRC